MNNLILDAAQCVLMTDMVSRMLRRRPGIRLLFWRTLPDSIPDLTAHMPALTKAVRRETDLEILRMLSAYPLPDTLLPETADWRTRLLMAWEKRRKTAREALDGAGGGLAWERGYWSWTQEYISSLKGLVQVDTCGTPSGLKCPSVLPILLSEALYVKKQFMVSKPSSRKFSTQSEWLSEQLECLAALSDWHPGRNVLTEPAVLKEWGSFWLELYQKDDMDTGEDEPDAQIIRKGIAAKAILNLLEAGGKEGTGIPAGMESLLLNSLTIATHVAGEGVGNYYHLDWLNWQPQDVTRFPANRLAKLPQTLLKIFATFCQRPDRWWDERLHKVLYAPLEGLLRWERFGLLTACGIDLPSRIITDVRRYLNNCMDMNIQSSDFLNHKLYRWLIRPEVAAIKEGREILQKLENHWQCECKSKDSDYSSRLIAWEGRIQLQRTRLATETPAAFQENLLEAIKNERFGEVRLVLSLWKPGKDTSNEMRNTWEYQWRRALKSENREISEPAALLFLRPDPADDPIARRQKLQDILPVLPKDTRPTLSIDEITHLAAALPLGNKDMHINQDWQYSTDGMNFRMPTERTARAATPITVQTTGPNRGAPKTAGGEPQSDGQGDSRIVPTRHGDSRIAPTTRHEQSRT